MKFLIVCTLIAVLIVQSLSEDVKGESAADVSAASYNSPTLFYCSLSLILSNLFGFLNV